MPRSHRGLLIFALGLACVVWAGRGRGQTPIVSPRVVLDMFAPSPIERGIIQDESRAPDSPETIWRRSIRRASGATDRALRSGNRYMPGRVIVKFRAGTSTASRVSTLSAMSRTASIAARPSYANFDVVQTDPNDDVEAMAQTLSQRPDVEYAQAAYRVHAELLPNDTFYSEQWNLPLIDLERAWDIQPSAGSSITVAVLDTGMAYTNTTMRFHASAFEIDASGDIVSPIDSGTRYPALGDLTLSFVAATQLASPGRFVAPHDFIWDDALPVDLDGHGTHVTGTIGQLTNDGVGTAGVAFNVKLMPVKVIDTVWDHIFGAPNQGTDDVVARGIRYAADNGANIVNLSIGRTGPPSPAIEDAVRYAVGKGAFVAIAGGNGFERGNPTEVLAEIASRVQGAVSVAAVDRARTHAHYSSTGSWVELAAPGGSFRGFGPTGGILQQTLNLDLVETFLNPPAQFAAPRFDSLAFYYFTGTSAATPHVAGVAAMLMQQGITNPAAVEAALERFATPCSESLNRCDASSSPPTRNATFGFGLVDARDTLRGLGLAK